jgi:hypothetical protein
MEFDIWKLLDDRSPLSDIVSGSIKLVFLAPNGITGEAIALRA